MFGVVHLTKAPTGDVVAGINGSSAFGEVARSVFGFAKDPESEEGHRIMSQAKNSAGEEDLSLVYKIESQAVTTDSGQTADVGKFVIVGDSDRTVSDVLRAGQNVDNDDEVCSWLKDYLKSRGKVSSRDAKHDAYTAEGHREYKVKRAAGKLKVVVTREGFPSATYWELPQSTQSAHVLAEHVPTVPTVPTGDVVSRARAPLFNMSADRAQLEQSEQSEQVQRTAVPTGRRPSGSPKEPSCRVCGKPVVGNQGDAHFTCQAAAS